MQFWKKKKRSMWAQNITAAVKGSAEKIIIWNYKVLFWLCSCKVWGVIQSQRVTEYDYYRNTATFKCILITWSRRWKSGGTVQPYWGSCDVRLERVSMYMSLCEPWRPEADHCSRVSLPSLLKHTSILYIHSLSYWLGILRHYSWHDTWGTPLFP